MAMPMEWWCCAVAEWTRVKQIDDKLTAGHNNLHQERCLVSRSVNSVCHSCFGGTFEVRSVLISLRSRKMANKLLFIYHIRRPDWPPVARKWNCFCKTALWYGSRKSDISPGMRACHVNCVCVKSDTNSARTSKHS